MTDAVDR